MRFSRRTLATLARLISVAMGHSDITALAYEFGVDSNIEGSNKLERSISLVRALERKCLEVDSDHTIIDFIEIVFSLLTEFQVENLREISGLNATLNMDGFELREHRIVPTTPSPAALGPELSALETDLNTRGLTVAANHYKQAFDNLTNGNFEACNGQIRSYLENLFIVICQQASSNTFDNPSSALQHLKDRDMLDVSEWNILRSFWGVCQTNGPHHGLSNQQEAIFRVHIATAIGRFLLHKFR